MAESLVGALKDVPSIFLMAKVEGRGKRAEGRGQKAKAEGRG
jgi:hypothetical protein